MMSNSREGCHHGNCIIATSFVITMSIYTGLVLGLMIVFIRVILEYCVHLEYCIVSRTISVLSFKLITIHKNVHF